jgi:hypothetical protein
MEMSVDLFIILMCTPKGTLLFLWIVKSQMSDAYGKSMVYKNEKKALSHKIRDQSCSGNDLTQKCTWLNK